MTENEAYVEAFYHAYTMRATEAAAVELLERSIIVTNVKARPVPPDNSTYIFYYAPVSDDFLKVLKIAVLKCWLDNMHNGVDPLASIAGMRRGQLLFAPYVLMENLNITQGERDSIEELGLNPIRMIVGQGVVLWGYYVWKNGQMLNPMTAENTACVRALVPHYGKHM